MNAPAPHQRPPYNPAMLRWAREWRGKTPEEAAKKLNKKPQDIIDWEDAQNLAAPTVKQARALAEFYGRHFLEFFLPAPPEIPSPSQIPDFRLHAGAPPPTDNWELRNILQWAETQRVNALDLFDELLEDPAEISPELFSEISADPEIAASKARKALGFSIQDQIGLPSAHADTLPNILRKKFEEFGILTLKHNQLKDFGIRGICIAAFPLPVIVFRNEAPSAQSFTLVHEFAHILLKESGITGSRTRVYENQPIEKWCDRFSASFLMPAEQIGAIYVNKSSSPAAEIADIELERLASIFRVSPHAMLIRLVYLGYVASSYYWDIKKPEFDAEEAKYRKFGRLTYYGSRYKASLGDLYTSLVMDAWSSGRITNHNAAEYMGIKNIAHLNDIKKAVRSK